MLTEESWSWRVFFFFFFPSWAEWTWKWARPLLGSAVGGQVGEEESSSFIVFPPSFICDRHQAARGCSLGVWMGRDDKNRGSKNTLSLICAPSEEWGDGCAAWPLFTPCYCGRKSLDRFWGAFWGRVLAPVPILEGFGLCCFGGLNLGLASLQSLSPPFPIPLEFFLNLSLSIPSFSTDDIFR